tara:strand:- start:334 stop:444 length:111 start_codon:yes stop_codon:yes gene_type:complete
VTQAEFETRLQSEISLAGVEQEAEFETRLKEERGDA